MAFGAVPAGTSSGPITTSIQVKNTSGILLGILVSSSTSGTLKAWDSLTAAGTVLFDTTGAITAPLYIPCNMAFGTGLFITVGATISCVAVYA